jgi:hypothetical protein
MKTYLLLILLFISGEVLHAQSPQVISGVVTDLKSGRPIEGVKVIAPELQIGAYTNAEGFYSFEIKKSGVILLEFRMLGYETLKKTVNPSTVSKLNVSLKMEDDVLQLENVEVFGVAKDANIRDNQISTIKLDIEQLKVLPAFMGEVDVIKTLQLMPGVSSASEGTQGFYVRGGGPDQNLVLLDGVHVYNATHLFGFFSVFNVDAVKSAELTKGGIPANYGGRLSSVLDIGMQEGSMERFGMKGGIGLISSRLMLEGPLKKDKGSFLVSGRRTYIDILMKPFVKESSPFSGMGYFFYDLNGKFTYRLTDKDKLTLSAYYGKDVFDFVTSEEDFNVSMPWGNGLVSLRWDHVFNERFFMTSRISLTDYQFAFNSMQEEFQFGLSSGIRDYSSAVEFVYRHSPRYRIKYGADHIYHQFTPFSVSANQQDVEFDVGEAQTIHGHESGIYISNELDVSEKFALTFGLRYSMFNHVGPFTRFYPSPLGVIDSTQTFSSGQRIATYHLPEPRIAARYLLNYKSSIKAGWNYNAQHIHLANLSAISLPTDIWYPATDMAPPQRGWQATLGYFRNFFDNTFETSVEIYYKNMTNLVEFKEGALPRENVQDNTDNLLTFGIGYSYGAEFFIRKNVGKFTGWVGYTWSKTERKFDDIFDGDWFPAKYDRRHDMSVVASYKLSERWVFGASFVYASGNTMTLPVSWYMHNGDIVFEYGPRNTARMPDFHRLDFSATWYDKSTKWVVDPASDNGDKMEIRKRFRSNFNFSIFNVYSRQNPFFLYVSTNGSLAENNFNMSLRQVSLFPILPSITWNFEF